MKPARLPCGRPQPKPDSPARDSDSLLKDMSARLETFCRDQKLNRTEAREKILETIVFEARHFTALDLLKRLQKRHPEVGRATLYRNLPVLVSSRVIQEGPTDASGQALYELSDEDHHDHIVCLDCRRIFEFHDEGIEKRQSKVTSELGFKPQGHRHVIYASCEYLARDAKA